MTSLGVSTEELCLTEGSHYRLTPRPLLQVEGFLRLGQLRAALLHRIKEGELNLNLLQSLAHHGSRQEVKKGGKSPCEKNPSPSIPIGYALVLFTPRHRSPDVPHLFLALP